MSKKSNFQGVLAVTVASNLTTQRLLLISCGTI